MCNVIDCIDELAMREYWGSYQGSNSLALADRRRIVTLCVPIGAQDLSCQTSVIASRITSFVLVLHIFVVAQSNDCIARRLQQARHHAGRMR
jgi:hypothetical protein